MRMDYKEEASSLTKENGSLDSKAILPFENIRTDTPYNVVMRVKIINRALVRYPQVTPLACRIKGCINKKRNGRCGLKKVELELDSDDILTGNCLMFVRIAKEGV